MSRLSLPPAARSLLRQSFEAAAMANSVDDPVDEDFADLSDSTTMPLGNTAASLGGSSSSSSAEQLASHTSSPSERSESKCKCSSAEELASESTLPCEQGRNNCVCCSKRKFDNDWTCDIIEGCMGEIVEAIGEFRELYQAMEYMKTWCKPKKPKNDVLEKLVKMSEEKEERLQQFIVEQQAAMAKMNEEMEDRLKKLMAEQQAVMAKIIADAVKDAVGGRPDSPAE